ncbi:PrpF domain-containing protein [Pseudochrobactrum kiredjianiae]|uniref:PrpF domain-containing protein n=1 Tax=Pseudochrobactrum kiredjianiae TaxID=386305 RepID=A0ABW3UZN1_9HYPH
MATRVEGGIVHEMIKQSTSQRDSDKFRIEHPSGYMDIYVDVRTKQGQFEVHRLSTIRTARKIMDV